MKERIQVLEEEVEELVKEKEGKGTKEAGREKDEKGKESVEDTERMLLAVLRELEGIPRCNLCSPTFHSLSNLSISKRLINDQPDKAIQRLINFQQHISQSPND